MPFKKGEKRPEGAGKPKGYHKKAAQFEELMEKPGGGWDAIAAALSDKQISTRLEAAKFCADHAYGKAPQTQAIAHSGINGQPMPTGDFLIALAARINADRLIP